MDTVKRATAADAGCWVDGHYGQYAVAIMVSVATQCGFADDELALIAARHLASMAAPSDSSSQLTDTEAEYLFDSSDRVESWLNEHVAPAGYLFGWHDGEFFLASDDWWQETP